MDELQGSEVHTGQLEVIIVERYFQRAQVNTIHAELRALVIYKGANYYIWQLLLAKKTSNFVWS